VLTKETVYIWKLNYICSSAHGFGAAGGGFLSDAVAAVDFAVGDWVGIGVDEGFF